MASADTLCWSPAGHISLAIDMCWEDPCAAGVTSRPWARSRHTMFSGLTTRQCLVMSSLSWACSDQTLIGEVWSGGGCGGGRPLPDMDRMRPGRSSSSARGL
jgi:hypothetical protein